MEQKDQFNPYAAPVLAEPVEIFGSQQTLNQVAAGLNLVYWALVLMLICIITIVFCVILRAPLGIITAYITIGSIVGFLAGGLMNIVGKCLCLAVPRETRSRPLITASVVCLVGWAICVLIFAVAVRQPYVRSIGWLLGFASMLLFLIFIKRIAEFVQRSDVAGRARAVIVLNVILSIVTVFLNVVTPVLGGTTVVIVAVLAFVILGIVYVVMYSRLLLDCRKAILGTL